MWVQPDVFGLFSMSVGSWPLLVKRVPHGMLPSAAEEVVDRSHLARGFPTPSPQSGAVTSDLSLVTTVVRHVPRPQLAVPPLVPGGVARASAHVGPIGSGG